MFYNYNIIILTEIKTTFDYAMNNQHIIDDEWLNGLTEVNVLRCTYKYIKDITLVFNEKYRCNCHINVIKFHTLDGYSSISSEPIHVQSCNKSDNDAT